MAEDQGNSLDDLLAPLRAGGQGLPAAVDEPHGMRGSDGEHGSHGMHGAAHDEPAVSTDARVHIHCRCDADDCR
jgi:hypothetical protein